MVISWSVAAADGLLHLITQAPPGRHRGTVGCAGLSDHEASLEITDEEEQQCLQQTTWHPSITEYLPGGMVRVQDKGRYASNDDSFEFSRGLGPCLQIAEEYS